MGRTRIVSLCSSFELGEESEEGNITDVEGLPAE